MKWVVGSAALLGLSLQGATLYMAAHAVSQAAITQAKLDAHQKSLDTAIAQFSKRFASLEAAITAQQKPVPIGPPAQPGPSIQPLTADQRISELHAP